MSKPVYIEDLEAKVKVLEENLKQLKAELNDWKISPQGKEYLVKLKSGSTDKNSKMEESDEEGWVEYNEPPRKEFPNMLSLLRNEWIPKDSKVESKDKEQSLKKNERPRPSKRHEKFQKRMCHVRQVYERGKKMLDGKDGEFEFVLMEAKQKFRMCGDWLNKVSGSNYEFKNKEEKQEFLKFQKQCSEAELNAIKKLKRFNRNGNGREAKEDTKKEEEEDEEAETGRKLSSSMQLILDITNQICGNENVKTPMKEKEDKMSLPTNPKLNSKVEINNARKMFEYLKRSSRERGDMLSKPMVKRFLKRISEARRRRFYQLVYDEDSQIDFDEGSLLKLLVAILYPKAPHGSGMRSHDLDLYDNAGHACDYDDDEYEDHEDDTFHEDGDTCRGGNVNSYVVNCDYDNQDYTDFGSYDDGHAYDDYTSYDAYAEDDNNCYEDGIATANACDDENGGDYGNNDDNDCSDWRVAASEDGESWSVQVDQEEEQGTLNQYQY